MEQYFFFAHISTSSLLRDILSYHIFNMHIEMKIVTCIHCSIFIFFTLLKKRRLSYILYRLTYSLFLWVSKWMNLFIAFWVQRGIEMCNFWHYENTMWRRHGPGFFLRNVSLISLQLSYLIRPVCLFVAFINSF